MAFSDRVSCDWPRLASGVVASSFVHGRVAGMREVDGRHVVTRVGGRAVLERRLRTLLDKVRSRRRSADFAADGNERIRVEDLADLAALVGHHEGQVQRNRTVRSVDHRCSPCNPD